MSRKINFYSMGTNTKTEKEIGPSISLLHSVDGEERERANRSVSGFRRSRRKRYDDLEEGKEREREEEGGRGEIGDCDKKWEG